MTLSELIELLQERESEVGDVEVFGTLFDFDDGTPIVEILDGGWTTTYDEHFVEPQALGINHPAYRGSMRRVLVSRIYMDWVR